MIFRLVLVLALVAAGSVASPLGAQALRNHNSNAPVDFDADHAEFQDQAKRAMLTGNVNIRQGDLTLTAARMTIAYTGTATGGHPDINRVDAAGGVTVHSPSESASGAFATYDLTRRIITMIGGVTLNQGANVLRGGRLVIDLTSGRSIIDGRSSSAGAGGTTTSGGRVSGRFSVPQRTN